MTEVNSLKTKEQNKIVKGVNTMKTKHIFKIFTIIIMVMLAIFTTGCESQQEKYTKASNELADYERKYAEDIGVKLDKINEEWKKSNDVKKFDELGDLAIRSIDEFEKNKKEKLENLQKIAKGDPELEKDVRIKWDEFNKKRNEALVTKDFIKNLIKQAKQQLGKQ